MEQTVNMNPTPSVNPMSPAPESKSKTILISLVVIALIALGATMIMKKAAEQQFAGEEQSALNQPVDFVQSQSALSAGASTKDIEADINNTDLENIDAGVDAEFK